jgi:hypothetical protein
MYYPIRPAPRDGSLNNFNYKLKSDEKGIDQNRLVGDIIRFGSRNRICADYDAAQEEIKNGGYQKEEQRQE